MNLFTLLIALFIGLWQTAPAQAADRVSVLLNWKHQFEFAAFYAAEAQGFYRASGLDVEIREGGPGIDTVKEVVAGQADFGVGASSLVADRYRGAPVVAIASLMQHSPVGILALRRHGINTVHDLAGRPVAVDPHNRDEVEAYLLAAGIPRERIRLVEQTDWTLGSLERGEIAAKIVYVSNEPFWFRGREQEYLLLTPRSAGIDLFGDVLFAHEKLLAERPETVKAFRAATLKGLVYALDHPEEVADLILTRYNSQRKSRQHLLFEAAQMRELGRHDIVEPGYMSTGRWRHVVEVLASRGKLPADFDLAGFIYDATPHKTPAWLLRTLAGLLAGLAVIALVAFKLRDLNRKLRREMGERAAVDTKYRELVDNANTLVLRMNVDGTVSYFNEFAQNFFGYTAEEVLGRHVVGTIVPERESDTDRDLADMIDAILAHPENFEHNENENITKDGRRVWVRWANKVLLDENGRPSGVSCFGQDITESRKAQEIIRTMAFYDTLTGLPNRRLLLDRLHQALALSARNGRYGALLFIDLDKFKQLNDTHGHDVGDRLLVEVARRLQACVREGDTVARLAGDEFVVMLEELDESPEAATGQAESVAAKIIEQLGQVHRFGDIEHHAGASVGIALFRDKTPDVDELIRRADLAMYQAKAAGRNTWRLFNEGLLPAA
ncbi:MAG: diguanylate cyclase [Sulfuritalea sp.]|nr:diguanylate cyclase [Sulfuritalea sp.]MDP1982644.1 diguanylate cyclase [Sulfuritalea sp.]